VLLYPVMPNKIAELRKVLALDETTLNLENAKKLSVLKPGTKIELKEPLFPRQESKPAVNAESRHDGAGNNLLDIAEFSKAKLKVAQVLRAEKVEGADKLLKLQIDLGTEQRQIVAGVAEFYSPEQITGKRIIVVSNLKPAKIRGIESNGMLLAAKKGKQLSLVTPEGDLPAGADVS
jgi:methionyl-tRNA synthetase